MCLYMQQRGKHMPHTFHMYACKLDGISCGIHEVGGEDLVQMKLVVGTKHSIG